MSVRLASIPVCVGASVRGPALACDVGSQRNLKTCVSVQLAESCSPYQQRQEGNEGLFVCLSGTYVGSTCVCS